MRERARKRHEGAAVDRKSSEVKAVSNGSWSKKNIASIKLRRNGRGDGGLRTRSKVRYEREHLKKEAVLLILGVMGGESDSEREGEDGGDSGRTGKKHESGNCCTSNHSIENRKRYKRGKFGRDSRIRETQGVANRGIVGLITKKLLGSGE